MSANGALMTKLGELHSVKFGQLKEGLEKQKNDKKEEDKMEERIVPKLKSESIDIDKLRQDAGHVREFVSKVRDFMMKSFFVLSIIRFLPPEERELAEEYKKRLIAKIEGAMQVKVVSAKVVALAAYTIANTTFCEAEKNDILDLLNDLENRGILIKSMAGKNFILAWDKKYVIAPSMRQHAPDITQALIALVSKAWEVEKAKYQEDKMSLTEKAGVNISIAELFAGKSGRAGFEVPAQQLKIYGIMEIIPRGFIVIENDGKKIAPIAGVGEIKQIITELREKKTALLPHVLRWNEFRVKIDEPEYFRRLYILFNLLRASLELYKKQPTSS